MKIYGAKGVKVCDEWQNNFIAFSNWAKANGYNSINGNTKCLAEWCIIYHISPSAVWLRTQKGIDIVTAITTPSRTRSKRYDG